MNMNEAVRFMVERAKRSEKIVGNQMGTNEIAVVQCLPVCRNGVA